jgi:hypothetical protein
LVAYVYIYLSGVLVYLCSKRMWLHAAQPRGHLQGWSADTQFTCSRIGHTRDPTVVGRYAAIEARKGTLVTRTWSQSQCCYREN